VNVLDSWGAILVVGVGNVFIVIVRRDIPARGGEAAGRPEVLVAGAIRSVW
jgi:hypothetical protein